MIVYLYFKDKISWKLWTNVLFFLHFSVFFMKNIWGYPYLKTHKKNSIEKNTPLFFSEFWMLKCLWCFWYMYVIFEYLLKRKGIKLTPPPPKKGAYQPMNMNPYLGYRKAINFKSLFFSIIKMLYKKLK